jgi:hypothetical protein
MSLLQRKFHLNHKPTCIGCFWAFWTQYLSIRFDLHIVGKLDWSAHFANEDQREKSSLTKESKDLALLISKLWLRQDEMPFEDHMITKGGDIIEVEFCMIKLVNFAWNS